MSQKTTEDQWSEIITPKKSWFDLRLNELWQYRDLIVLFVRRDFVAVYKQTILGPLWHIIQPLFTTLVFVLVFGKIAGLSTDGQPAFLFYMCGVTIWNYFASNLNKTSNTFVENQAVFGKVYFPRLTVPVSNVISGLFSFTIQFVLFLIFYLIYYLRGAQLQPNLWLLAIPLFILIMAILSLGLGIIISSLTTKYRDLTMLIGFGVQLFMYASPVIYPMSSLSPKLQYYMQFNPVASILEGFKYAFFGQGIVSINSVGYSLLIAGFVFFIGVALFHRIEKTFMDTV
ncbi:ABC transporter permease [Microscilla marina]|uniref:Transport permease protein n=1 Tax=Microscilla marina ATCC 23134 TaxID=313606 RepID=A1ZCI2_MICM2|nr:ABC transporter permease [Microscilla marina]EAY31984.1 ABC transporter, permease protein [Microscilla marina ATCC 23134]